LVWNWQPCEFLYEFWNGTISACHLCSISTLLSSKYSTLGLENLVVQVYVLLRRAMQSGVQLQDVLALGIIYLTFFRYSSHFFSI
jgi:hypothetical protein